VQDGAACSRLALRLWYQGSIQKVLPYAAFPLSHTRPFATIFPFRGLTLKFQFPAKNWIFRVRPRFYRRGTVVVDDGRRYLERAGKQFDVILMNPLRTTSIYIGDLNSRQFFWLARSRMKPAGVLMAGGIVDNPVIRRPLLEEFNYVRACDGFSLASQVPLHQSVERRERLLTAHPADIQAEIEVFMRGCLEGKALEADTAGYAANEDWAPISEYYLGLQLTQRFYSGASAVVIR
jgi:hypothetical protein